MCRISILATTIFIATAAHSVGALADQADTPAAAVVSAGTPSIGGPPLSPPIAAGPLTPTLQSVTPAPQPQAPPTLAPAQKASSAPPVK